VSVPAPSEQVDTDEPSAPDPVEPPAQEPSPAEEPLPEEEPPPVAEPSEPEPPPPVEEEPPAPPEEEEPPAPPEEEEEEPPAPPVIEEPPAPPEEEDPPVPPVATNPGGTVGPGSPEVPAGLEAFHITVIGSSTAAGIGASNGELNWVTLLDDALVAKVRASYSTSNLAVGGYTALDITPGSGLPGSIDQAIAEKPDLIIVAIAGSNDLAPGFTTERFIAQLVSVRELAKAAGIPTFFMSTLPKNLTPGERDLLEQWSVAMTSEFSQCWIPGTTKAYAPCYIDVFQALADSSLGLAAQFDSGDGQHPNDAGHALLFRAVDAIVEPYVCTKTECR
jgi:lysophospholipase L1-like esterase